MLLFYHCIVPCFHFFLPWFPSPVQNIHFPSLSLQQFYRKAWERPESIITLSRLASVLKNQMYKIKAGLFKVFPREQFHSFTQLAVPRAQMNSGCVNCTFSWAVLIRTLSIVGCVAVWSLIQKHVGHLHHQGIYTNLHIAKMIFALEKDVWRPYETHTIVLHWNVRMWVSTGNTLKL